MQIKVKMVAKDVRFKILINNSEDKNFFRLQFVFIVKKNVPVPGTCFIENYFSLKLF